MNGTDTIMSYDDYVSAMKSLDTFKHSLEKTITDCKTVIDSFSNEAIVNSFYKSGKFGNKEKVRMEEIYAAITKYYGVLDNGEDSLIYQTKSFINKQLSLLETGSIEGSSSTSY